MSSDSSAKSLDEMQTDFQILIYWVMRLIICTDLFLMMMIIMCACNMISPSANKACMRIIKNHQFYSSGREQFFRKQELKR